MATVQELMVRLTNRAGDLSRIVNDTAVTLQPAATLTNTFGPLTDNLTQKETLSVASHFLSILTFKGGKYANHDRDKEQLEIALSAVRSEISSSNLSTSGASLTMLIDAVTINNMVQAAGDSVVSKIKTAYTETQPKAFQALDVGLAVGATAIPYAGPLVGGFIMGGPKAAIALELGAIGSAYAPTLSNTPDKNQSAWEKAQQGGVKDVLKDGGKDAGYTAKIDSELKDAMGNKDLLLSAPSSYGVGLIWWGIMRIKLGMTEAAINEVKTSGHLQIFNETSATNRILSQSINPQTRNQLAVGSKIHEYVDSSSLNFGSGKIESLVDTKSKTLKEFIEKTKNANKAVRKAFESVIYIGIRNSFGPELNRYREAVNKITGINQEYRLGPNIDDKYTNVIALLVVSYYYLEGRKTQDPSFNANKLEFSEFKFNSGINLGLPERAVALNSLSETQAIKAFKEHKNFTSESLWPQVKNKSEKYIKTIKEALVYDLGQPFKSNADGSIKKALELYFTCAMIVVDNISRKEARAGKGAMSKLFMATGATQIPDGAIDMLSELGFVNKYSTWTGTVSDDQKKAATAGHKLRYYSGKWTVKGSSRSEKMMIFVFSLIVLSVVDIVQICAGYQDWNQTKKLLELIIDKINLAEMEMDQEI